MIKRCSHGFPAGMCRCPVCPHFEGDVREDSTAPRCCEACGRVTTRPALCAVCAPTAKVTRSAKRKLERNHHV